MSFSSEGTVTVAASIDVCYDVLSDPALFEEFMLYDITSTVSITARDTVHLADDLTLHELTPRDKLDHGINTLEECARIFFKLTEVVSYLGIAKEIPVSGYLVTSKSRRLHVEHRSASDGLVVTDKVRRFKELRAPDETTQKQANREGNKEGKSEGQVDDVDEEASLDELVVDVESTTSTTLQSNCTGTIPATLIEETLKGTTSWYLKYFTEIEARRSHQAFMARYDEFVRRKQQRT